MSTSPISNGARWVEAKAVLRPASNSTLAVGRLGDDLSPVVNLVARWRPEGWLPLAHFGQDHGIAAGVPGRRQSDQRAGAMVRTPVDDQLEPIAAKDRRTAWALRSKLESIN